MDRKALEQRRDLLLAQIEALCAGHKRELDALKADLHEVTKLLRRFERLEKAAAGIGRTDE